ncbi:hypothetical protein ACQR1K_35580 [Bradyrhizobium sp. HKCCYLRH3095]|uniref:hypothetical protein n=1 Tax=Bradyrhizobium sp. HKCCYLRH3095 TaxID=3420765 RepID=UPI003EB7DA1A
MTNVKVMSWNIQHFGIPKLTNSPFLPQLVAETILQEGVHILVILELKSGGTAQTLTPIGTFLNQGTNTQWNTASINVGNESVGFVWDGSVVQAVAGQKVGRLASDVICVNANDRPIYFPQRGTLWTNAKKRPNGRRPAYMLFQTAAAPQTPFIVAGLHSPLSTSNIQAYGARQYGRARETTRPCLNSVTQNLEALKININGISATIRALLGAAQISNAPKEVDLITDKIVKVLDIVAFRERLIVYDNWIWVELLQKVLDTIILKPWQPGNLNRCRVLMLQTVTAAAAFLEEIWPMPNGTAATALSNYMANPVCNTWSYDATLSVGGNAAAMIHEANVPNPFEDVDEEVEGVAVDYCILAGDFNIECPDLNSYDKRQTDLLSVPGCTGKIDAYTSLSTAIMGHTARGIAFQDILTTCPNDSDQPYQYTWSQAGFSALQANATTPTLLTICKALATLKGANFCGLDEANVQIRAALVAQGAPPKTLEDYKKEILTVFLKVLPYNSTDYVGVSAYDNFGYQYPISVANPFTTALPSMLASLGSWQTNTAGPCNWTAAAGQLTAVVQPSLTQTPLNVNGRAVPPNLPTVADAALFYKRLISDHFPIAIEVALP